MIDKGRRILIVDDDPSMRLALSETLESCGYEVESADNGSEALKKFQGRPFEVVVTDMRMPRMGGMEVLKGVKKISPRTPVILITAYGTVSTAVEAMKEGASEFIMKPFSLDDLQGVVKNVLANSPARMNEAASPDISGSSRMDIITQAANMTSLLALMRSIAKSKSSVLIQGESGTGKELFARYIHRHSTRKNRPFIAVNCAAIPHHLLESEMFGHEKSAFTGANRQYTGRCEQAHNSTLFLDEIAEMDINLQPKLLRFLQEQTFYRVGGKDKIHVDARIVAATNRVPLEAIKNNQLREDLYYRLNVVNIQIPPLREHREDIPDLAHFFLALYSEENNKSFQRISVEALRTMKSYPWPGNIRELENCIQQSVVLHSGEVLERYMLPQPIQAIEPRDLPSSIEGEEPPAVPISRPSKILPISEYEKKAIEHALELTLGNVGEAAEGLQMSQATLYRKIREFGLNIKEYKP